MFCRQHECLRNLSNMMCLLNRQACSSEVMMLRVARRYDAATDSVLFANNQAYTRDNYRKAGMAYVIEDLLHFCRCMYAMMMDNVHYALLTAIVIFSGQLYIAFEIGFKVCILLHIEL